MAEFENSVADKEVIENLIKRLEEEYGKMIHNDDVAKFERGERVLDVLVDFASVLQVSDETILKFKKIKVEQRTIFEQNKKNF